MGDSLMAKPYALNVKTLGSTPSLPKYKYYKSPY